jgi:hypothetical protein
MAASYATDRNADFILGAGAMGGKVDGDNVFGGNVQGEIALSKDKTWSLLIGGSAQKVDNIMDEKDFDGSIGIKKYLLPETSVALVGGVLYGQGDMDEEVGVVMPGAIAALGLDYDVDVWVPYIGIQLKQRLLPSDRLFSPYVGISALISKPEAEVDGRVEFLGVNTRGRYYIYAEEDADDVIDYDYDVRFHLIGSAGVDINFYKNMGLAIEANLGEVFGSGTVKFGEEEDDMDDSFTVWQIGSALKFYF